MSERSFFEAAIRANALQFGAYELKSGRMSPYFFNAGLFHNGQDLHQLARCYAAKIVSQNINFDILFGPAYKGIPLAAIVCSVLFEKYGREVSFCYNRKEKKAHGEGGTLVGADLQNKKVLIIDDVITAGTAIAASVQLIQAQHAEIIGVVVALDRQEIAPKAKLSAIQVIEKNYGFPVFAIATFEQLIRFVQNSNNFSHALVQRIQNYQKSYGISNYD